MHYDWAIIGAGPAGIAAVGKLLDAGIAAEKIIWIDPVFKVGDFGMLWGNVPSNTKVKLFLKYLTHCKAFAFSEIAQDFAITKLNPEETCDLKVMAQALYGVSERLKAQVNFICDTAHVLQLSQRKWHLGFAKHNPITANNVILAIGCEAKTLDYPSLEIIPISDALDDQKLKQQIHTDDNIAVFGSSHSAVLVLKNLHALKPKRVINFYRSPLQYASDQGDWILFDDTGLKGIAAAWARQYLDGDMPQHLERYYANAENIESYLPECNKVIYAIGFNRRLLPIIKDYVHHDYNPYCGIIAPGLFGVGIAYPQAKYNPLGMLEYRVGLWKFMDYLTHILPIWLTYSA